MREFNFDDELTLAEIKVDGKVYTFDPFDAEMLNELAKAGKKVASIDRTKAAPATMLALSKELQNTVGIILGKEAQEEIFSNPKRKNNIVKQLMLLNEIHAAREEVNADEQMANLAAMLAGYDTETVDG